MTNQIQLQATVWSECFAPDATSDRGWLKALCAPIEDRMDYTYETMPIPDDVPGGWREQSTLGNYLNYAPVRPYADGPQVHCICYLTKTTKYVATVAEAKAWIESEALRARPYLAVQQTLALTA